MSGYRLGSGFDAHRLVAGRPLLLGGIRLEYDRGLLGHSDGDCLLHAVCDALLGAAGVGDLGEHFPSSEPRHANAASLGFLKEVAQMLDARGFGVVNVDATLIAEAPRLAAHLPRMREAIADGLGVGVDRISIKAKSADGLGALGRGEGIAAQAVALLRSKADAPEPQNRGS